MNFGKFFLQKIIVLFLLSAWGGLPYHLIQKIDFSKVITMPALKIDHLIPTNLDWVWIYHSWLFLPLVVVLLIPHWPLLKRFAWAMFAVNAVSFLVFLCVPTEAPRPSDLTDAPRLYLLTIQLDEPTNACPSLHASVTSLCTVFAFLLLSRLRRYWLCRTGIFLWAGGILWSTLATRQHVFLDIVAGTTLGIVVALVALRWSVEEDETSWTSEDWEGAY